jgi:hypothetical protein
LVRYGAGAGLQGRGGRLISSCSAWTDGQSQCRHARLAAERNRPIQSLVRRRRPRPASKTDMSPVAVVIVPCCCAAQARHAIGSVPEKVVHRTGAFARSVRPLCPCEDRKVGAYSQKWVRESFLGTDSSRTIGVLPLCSSIARKTSPSEKLLRRTIARGPVAVVAAAARAPAVPESLGAGAPCLG